MFRTKYKLKAELRIRAGETEMTREQFRARMECEVSSLEFVQ